jgi:hypothetical protein
MITHYGPIPGPIANSSSDTHRLGQFLSDFVVDVGPLGEENMDNRAAAAEEQPTDKGAALIQSDILMTDINHCVALIAVFPANSQSVQGSSSQALAGAVSIGAWDHKVPIDEAQAGPSSIPMVG